MWAPRYWTTNYWSGRYWTPGVEEAAVGGYTPYAVYDPDQEKRLRDKREELRLERQQLRADIEFLVTGRPAFEARPPQPLSKKARKRRSRADAAVVLELPRIDRAVVEQHRSRLEVVQNELLAMHRDIEVLRLLHQRRAEEEDLVTILLLSDLMS